MRRVPPSKDSRLDLNSQCLVLDLRVKPQDAKNKRLTEIFPWFCPEPVYVFPACKGIWLIFHWILTNAAEIQ